MTANRSGDRQDCVNGMDDRARIIGTSISESGAPIDIPDAQEGAMAGANGAIDGAREQSSEHGNSIPRIPGSSGSIIDPRNGSPESINIGRADAAPPNIGDVVPPLARSGLAVPHEAINDEVIEDDIARQSPRHAISIAPVSN
jgi:hypothetical protein